MLFVKRVVSSSLTLFLLSLGACANSPLGQTVERSLQADPQLQNPGASAPSPSTNADGSEPPQSSFAVQLPTNFPDQVPRYPNAELVAVVPDSTGQSNGATETRWRTTDAGDRVRQFYQDTFQSENWQIVSTGSSGSASLVAERDGVRVAVAIATPASTSPISTPSSTGTTATGTTATGTTATGTTAPSPQAATEFTLAYKTSSSTAETSTDSPSAAAAPQPGSPDFIGPVLPANLATSDAQHPEAQQNGDSAAATPSQFSDLNQAPQELRSYLTDLSQLGVLQLSPSSPSATTAQAFKPNQIITRREYARWLVAVNNRIFSDRPANRIRSGSTTAQPAFQDVPRSDPDFAAIQGLAEAGLIPSSLSGDATTVTFHPNAPLTRENLILWKTPIDLRQTLPNATIQAVQQTWGFQDAARIDPKALRAVLADYQNGDLSNIRRAFGYTTLFQPKKTVTRAETAAVLWYFGTQGEGASAKDVLQREK